ncbi:MAG TPA: hypothetical protein VMV18_15790 [bacterium]|nr:hypothetical protein [bacterium]
MANPNRREFLELLGLSPFAIAATAAAARKTVTPVPAPSPTATPPADPLKELKELHIADGAEPALVFRASRADGKG